MKDLLYKLIESLIKIGSDEAAGDVSELYEEDWHEEVVKEFGEEPVSEEEYFDENFKYLNNQFGEFSDYYNIMEKEGFKPYRVSTSASPFLSSGASGVVFRGIYNGKDAAMKIVLDNTGHNEIAMWNNIIKIKNAMPGEYSKYIPTIYKTGHGNIKSKVIGGVGAELEYYFVVMEFLRPLDAKRKDVLFGNIRSSDVAATLLKDEDFLYEIAKSIVNRVYVPEDLKNMLDVNYIFKILLESLGGEDYYESIEEASKHIAKYIKQITDNNFQDYELSSYIDDEVYSIIDYRLSAKEFPMFYSQFAGELEDYKSWSVNNPELYNFIGMLNYMHENYGIRWRDVHSGNIMIGNDDNLKLIDVGYFDA